jgi:ribosomal protein S18 acetylase RimI-like enzyme
VVGRADLLLVRPIGPDDAPYQLDALRRHTAGPRVVSRGRLHDGMAFGGYLAEIDGDPAGVAIVRPEPDDASVELLFIAADVGGAGVGAALLAACVDGARAAGAQRVWLVTTNDNTPAIRFYQRQGWDLAEPHRDAVTGARALKPEIPLRGHDDIEIRHELVFELRLDGGDAPGSVDDRRR